MIKLTMIGHLGKDAEVRDVNGRKVIAFNVAHTEKYRDAQGNPQSKTTWVRCSYWTDNTNVAPYLKTGTQVYVEGTPSADAYMSTTQNQPMASLDLRVNKIELLGGGSDAPRPESNATDRSQPNGSEKTTEKTTTKPPPVQAEDDLPF
jgi:single-strand DNA-binding protein